MRIVKQITVIMCTFLLIVTAPDICGEAMVLENDDDMIVFTEENGSPVIVAQNDNLDNDTHALIEEPTSEAKTLATVHRYSGDYTLDYLMNHFGIIAFGNVDLQQHCMGNLLIKGDLSGNHNNFADSPNNVEPSYIGGYVSKPGGPNGRSKYTGVPLYVGGLNTVTGTTLNVFERYNHDDPIYVTDDYISWDSVYAAGTEEVSHIQSLTADLDPVVTQWNWQEVTVTRGTITNLITNGQYCKIHLSGEATGAMTVINILDSGSVINPQVVGLSQGEENGGSEPICIVYPNANTVVIPVELTPEIGCVLAPYADIQINGGNTNGCLFGQNVTTYAEGHMWPYSGYFQTPQSESETQSESDSEPVQSESEMPQSESLSESQSEDQPEPFTSPEGDLGDETESETIPQTETISEQQSESITEVLTEVVTETETEKMTETENTTEIVTEKESETLPTETMIIEKESETQAATERITQSYLETEVVITESQSESISEITTEVVTERQTEMVAETKPEIVSEKVTERQTQKITEKETEKSTEIITEKKTEAVNKTEKQIEMRIDSTINETMLQETQPLTTEETERAGSVLGAHGPRDNVRDSNKLKKDRGVRGESRERETEETIPGIQTEVTVLVQSIPKTGDNTPVIRWLIVLVTSLVAIMCFIYLLWKDKD